MGIYFSDVESDAPGYCVIMRINGDALVLALTTAHAQTLDARAVSHPGNTRSQTPPPNLNARGRGSSFFPSRAIRILRVEARARKTGGGGKIRMVYIYIYFEGFLCVGAGMLAQPIRVQCHMTVTFFL